MSEEVPITRLVRNCPFCGHVPIAPSQIKRKKSVTRCINIKCPIFGIFIEVGMWNGEVALFFEREFERKHGDHTE